MPVHWQRGNGHSSQVATWNLLSLFSNTPGVYKLPAVPSGAAQGAHYPAGTRGDIQAVLTGKLSLIAYGRLIRVLAEHQHHDRFDLKLSSVFQVQLS